MGRRHGAVAAVWLLGAGLLAGCVGGRDDHVSACDPTEVPPLDDFDIVIEGDPWSGYAPFRDPGLLEGTRYTAVYAEQLCQDLRALDVSTGQAGIALTTLDQYVLHQPDATIVGVIDQSLGADALVLNTVDLPYLDSVDDLPQLFEDYDGRGAKPVLAYTGNSPSEMLLNELANTTDELHLADFDLVSVDVSTTAYEMLENHEAAVAIVWEPETSAARAAGYTVALSSRDVPDSIVDVIVASNTLLAEDPDAVEAVLAAFYTKTDRYLASPSELTAFIAEDSDGVLDLESAQTMLGGVKLYGTAEADAFMNSSVFPFDQPQVLQSLHAISAVLALVHPGIDPDQAQVDGSYVAALARSLAGQGEGQG